MSVTDASHEELVFCKPRRTNIDRELHACLKSFDSKESMRWLHKFQFICSQIPLYHKLKTEVKHNKYLHCANAASQEPHIPKKASLLQPGPYLELTLVSSVKRPRAVRSHKIQKIMYKNASRIYCTSKSTCQIYAICVGYACVRSAKPPNGNAAIHIHLRKRRQ